MGRGSSKGGGGGGNVPELHPNPNGGNSDNKEPFSNSGVGMRELTSLKSALDKGEFTEKNDAIF